MNVDDYDCVDFWRTDCLRTKIDKKFDKKT